jgi:hypothetical protein
MVVIAWLTLWLSFRWSLRITGKRALAWLCTWVLAGSIFFASLAGYLYPDMPVAALALAYLLLATSKNRRVQTLFVMSIVAGLSLFFHFKSLVLFGPLVAWSLYGLIKDRAGMKAYIALLLPVGLSFVAFEVSTYLWFGTWLPNRIIGDNIPLLQISPLLSISAVLFDVGKGVFSNNPAYLLILPGLVLWHRHSKTTFWWAVLAFVPTFLMQATFVDWHGGFAPPGRYLSELLPLLVPAIGLMAGAVASRWGKAVVYMLILWQFILTSLYFGLRAPWALTGSENPATQKLGLAWLWPHFTRQTQLADRRSFWVIVLWLVVLTALALWGWHITKREHHA